MRAVVLFWLVLGTTSCGFFPTRSSCDRVCAQSGACQLRMTHAGESLYRCYAGTDADCEQSEVCRTSRRCHVTEHGSCARLEDVPAQTCALSPECQRRGACAPRLGFCEAQSDAHCEASYECKTAGRCKLDAPRGMCRIADAAACLHTTGCELEGLCTYVADPFGGYGSCALTPTGDCSQSVACKQFDRCVPRALDACSEGCRIFYCGHADAARAPHPCLEGADSACEPDGRCIRDATGRCVRWP